MDEWLKGAASDTLNASYTNAGIKARKEREPEMLSSIELSII